MIAEYVHEACRVRAVFGRGSRTGLQEEMRRLGARRVMLVTSAGTLRRNAELIAAFGPIAGPAFAEVEPHCPVEVAEAALDRFRDAGCDGIVTIGGGSTIGIGKFIRLRRGVPYVALPTTYSGSEMTPIHGVKIGREKRTGRDPAAMPDTVIYDPELTLSLPADETAGTGMNSLAHCFEAFYPRVPNPLAAPLAIEGVLAHFRGLPTCIDAPTDIEARSLALHGGFIGGLLVQLVGIGLHHQLCHVLGGHFGLPHGASNSIVLPHVVAFNEDAIRIAAPGLATRLGEAGIGGAVFDLARRIGAPADLRGHGVPASALPDIARETLAHLSHNPRAITEGDLTAMLERAWRGDPPPR